MPFKIIVFFKQTNKQTYFTVIVCVLSLQKKKNQLEPGCFLIGQALPMYKAHWVMLHLKKEKQKKVPACKKLFSLGIKAVLTATYSVVLFPLLSAWNVLAGFAFLFFN